MDPTTTPPTPGRLQAHAGASVTVPVPAAPPSAPRTGLHPAWWVAAVAFVALLGAAGFRAAPGV